MPDKIASEMLPSPVVSESSPSPSKNVNHNMWGKLLHEAILGNGEFPQAFPAQGIRVARPMVELVTTKQATWQEFLHEEPDDEFFNKMEESKTRAHAAHGFQTSFKGDMQSVWRVDRLHALGFIGSLAQIAYQSAQGGEFKGNKGELLEEVFSDSAKYPVDWIENSIVLANTILSSPEVKDQSKAYRDIIAEYMRKYSLGEYDPFMYMLDTHNAYRKTNMILHAVFENIKGHLERNAPEEIKSLLEGESLNGLFGDVSVTKFSARSSKR